MIGIDSIKPHYEIRVKDLDPETGEVCRDWPISIALEKQATVTIVNALNTSAGDSNRRYYFIHREEIKQ
jgi:hypothetical protein